MASLVQWKFCWSDLYNYSELQILWHVFRFNYTTYDQLLLQGTSKDR